ncbi:hypothetical protein KYG_13281 [Acidovorax sp. NO-1]|nr:hypothetical protein KYG_13281 [Acidovorax sp. NO-1]
MAKPEASTNSHTASIKDAALRLVVVRKRNFMAEK